MNSFSLQLENKILRDSGDHQGPKKASRSIFFINKSTTHVQLILR